MVFSSILFLFLFLPIILLLYYVFGSRFRNSLLLIASLLFYAWGEGGYVFLMLVSVGINYIFGILVEKKVGVQARTRVVVSAVVANLALLIFYKYSGFLVENLNIILVTCNLQPLKLATPHLPIGISFFTFHALSYVIDVFRHKTVAQKNFFKLGLYISFFPQLIAGPIIRYHDVADQLSKRFHSVGDFAYGIERFIIGLGKKVLIANVMASIADSVFELPASELSFSEAWLGIVCYTLQIYFDFSGYSDMAIGLARMFGFHFLENFNYPYISQSMQEFWRRWHISLSNWFRDYLYIPLGGSRVGPGRTYCNLLIVFVLCGLWHGADWTFLAWGIFHGFFLVIERWKLSAILSTWPRFCRHLYAILTINISWVLFRVKTLEEGINYLAAMFGFGGEPVVHPWLLAKTDSLVFFVIGVGMLFSTPVYPYLRKTLLTFKEEWHDTMRGQSFLSILYGCRIGFLGSIFMLSVMSLASGTYNPFIYFRF